MSSESLNHISGKEFDSVAADYSKLIDENVRITGEASSYFAAYKASYLVRLGISGVGTKILDFGCGVGLLSEQLKLCFPEARIDGFDVSAESVARASPALLAQGSFTSNRAALASDYGVVILANVLHHVPLPNRASVLQEAASRLAPGGKLVVIEHNPMNPLTKWAVSQCPFDEGVTLLTARDVRLLCALRLEVVATDYLIFFPRWLSWLRPVEPLLGWCPAGAQHATVAQKLPQA